MGLRLNSNSGFAIRKLMVGKWASASSRALVECDAVWKPSPEGSPLGKSAQTGVSVPLKGADRSKRAGTVLAVQRRKLKGDCDERRPVPVVFLFDVSFFFNSCTPEASVSYVEVEI